MRKLLEKCHELGASSLAMPMIGAGQHGFPVEVVLKVLRNEINQFSSSKGAQLTLKDIRVIVFQSKPERRQTVPLPIRPGISTPSTLDQNERNSETSSTEIAFGPVHIYLRGGSITQYQADAFLNFSATHVKVSATTFPSTNIRQSDDEIDFIDSTREESMTPPPGTVLVTNASSCANVRYIMHCVPVSFDISGLERAMKACLDAAQYFPLNSFVISATGITSLSVAPNECANAILNASKTFSNANFIIDITVVGFDKDTMQIFKTALEEKAKEQLKSVRFHDNDQPASSKDVAMKHQLPVDKIVNIGGKEKVIFRVVGFRDNVDVSIEKIEAYFNRCKVNKSIKDEKIVNGFWKHNTEIKKLSKGYDISITLSADEVSIEGMTEQVFDCKDVLIDFLNKNDEKERKWKILREISESVQWSYSDVNSTILFDEILNGMVENECRVGNKIITIPGTESTYEVDLEKMVIEESQTGCTALLARKHMGNTSGNFLNYILIKTGSH